MTERTRSLLIALALVGALWPGKGAAQTDTTNVWFSNGPTGFTGVLDIEVLPLAPDTLLAGAFDFAGTNSGVFRSLNRGSTWAQTFVDTVLSIAVNARSAQVNYAGTLSRGVFKSVDGGATWVATGLGGVRVDAIVVDPDDTSRVFAGSLDSVVVSLDGGTTWAKAGLDTVNVSALAINPLGPDTVYVGTDTVGVFRTYDGGTTWLQINTGLGSLRIIEVVVNPLNPDLVYAATTDAGVFRSTDRGNTWSAANNGLASLGMTSLGLAPGSPSILYAGTDMGEVFKSSDNGITWFDLTRNIPTVEVDAVAVHPDSPNVVYAGMRGLTTAAVQRLKQTGLDSVNFLITGPDPRGLSSADLDGDGLADLIAANHASNTLSVLLTRSSGALFDRVDYRAGDGPVDVAVTDLDLDGDLDLVSANRIKETISILFNDSTGVFSLPVDLFVGGPAAHLALADFDSDQDVDIVVSDEAAGRLHIFLNDGMGSFEAPDLLQVGSSHDALEAGDFTGNGLIDLLVLSRMEGTFRLLINQGNATFSQQTPVTPGSTPVHLAPEDFDRDGDRDVAVAMENSQVSLYLNDGSGAFSLSNSYAVGDTAAALEAADIDHDRYADLLVPRGDGNVTVLVNDGNGAFPTSFSLGDVQGAGASVSADVNADGKPDVAVLDPDGNGLTLFANNVDTLIKLPAPPLKMEAEDLQGDLGGNVNLTWRRPRVDEETGRIVSYRVFRASAQSGPYSEIVRFDTSAAQTKDSTFVFRSFIDSSATVNQAFYYYAVSENVAEVASASSDTASASSGAQPFFDFVYTENSPYHIQDTIVTTVRLNPVGHDVQSLSIFMDYDSLAFTLLDGDSGTSGLQPFAVDSTLASSAKVLQNGLDNGVAGQINFGLGFLPVLADEPVPIGNLTFVALKDTLTQIQVVSDTASVRQTVLTARSDGALILPYIPPPSTLILRNHKVPGSVSFQGRTDGLDLDIRFDLTLTDSLGTPLPDSVAYAPPNDLDLNENGVQTILAPDGGFTLLQVASGSYGLFAKTFHYLRARVSGDSVVVNDSLGVSSPVSFRWVSADSSIVSTELRAGDANDDNRADLADFGILAANFGASGFDVGSVAWGADFNGDGVVTLADFALLQSNFGEQGLGPAVPAKPVVTGTRVAISWAQPLVGELKIKGAQATVGFSADLVAPSGAGLTRSGMQSGDFLVVDGRPLFLVREMAGEGEVRFRVAAVLSGRQAGLSGNGHLLSFKISDRAFKDRIRLENVQVLNATGHVAYVAGYELPFRNASDLPDRPSLMQNLPNPFNPATTIPFNVSEVARVELIVYNTLGQEVRRLVREVLPPGYHQATWDGRDELGRYVASGVYLYRVAIGRFVDVKKAVLLK